MKTLQDKFQLLTNNDTKDSIRKIKSILPASARCYLVGGCVRDLLMNKTPHDIDIEVYNISKDEFERYMDALGANGVGKSYFVYKYNNCDISLPRSESKDGTGHKGFAVDIETDMQKATARRDFTINAMLIDLESFELIDFFGGMNDITAGTIRMIEAKSFAQDSLRVLRGVQFSARFGFRINKETLATCQNIELSDLSYERIRLEFAKLFEGDFPHFGLYYLAKTRVLEKIFSLRLEREKYIRCAISITRSCKKITALDKKADVAGVFFYHLAFEFKLQSVKLWQKLGATNKHLADAKAQIPYPKRVSMRFLVALSIKMPLCEWIGSYEAHILPLALDSGFWDRRFAPEVTSQDALSLGLKNEQIGKFLRIERSREIREKF